MFEFIAIAAIVFFTRVICESVCEAAFRVLRARRG
jgi:hypothetical protein